MRKILGGTLQNIIKGLSAEIKDVGELKEKRKVARAQEADQGASRPL
jgi:hypothetical protein